MALALELRTRSERIGFYSCMILFVAFSLINFAFSFIVALLVAIGVAIVWGVLSMRHLRKKTDHLVNSLTYIHGDTLALVREFHETYGVPIRSYPSLDIADKQLIVDLIEEEVQELKAAIERGDIVEVFDALLDISWVTISGTIKIGLPYSSGIEEVARSNRTKLGLDGFPVYGENNKVLKGPNYSPPDLKKVLDAPQLNSKSR